MSHILNKIRNVDPNNSDAVKECVTVFFQNLLKYSEHSKWLRAVNDVLRRFSKYCIPHRGTIESFIVKYLDSNNYHNVIEAAKCGHSLQQVRPEQEKTSTPKSCWKNQITLLCSLVHNLIYKLFPDSPRLYGNKGNTCQNVSKTPLNTALAKITKTSDQHFDSRKVLITRLKNIFIFIQAMLVESYPVAKPIEPQLILDSLLHALSVAQSQGQPLNDIVEMKTETLRTLNALIACLGSHLIPYSPLVFRLVMQTLRWTSDNRIEETKSVRCLAYNSLKQWLSVLHVHKLSDSRASMEDELTTQIINDITPPKTSIVQLTLGAQPMKNLSKKAKRKLARMQLQESTISRHMPEEKNKSAKSDKSNEIAIAALECAESLFIVCGIFLKPTTHKIFQECLVRECFNISSYSGNQPLLLLRTLDACRKTSPNTVPPPTQYCLHLFSTNVNSSQSEIATFCSRAILDIRLHLYCSPPSLTFALQVNEEKTDRPKTKISEKNRAALEFLLGKNKLTTRYPDEIITIADEPATKKPRLSEDADKISLSSENITSFEISDDSDSEVVEETIEILDKSKDEETLESNINLKDTNLSLNRMIGVIDVENELQNVDESSEVDVSDTICNMQTQVKPQTEIIDDKIDLPGNVTDTNKHDMATEIPNTIKEIEAMCEAPTQLPLNESSGSINVEEVPSSLEVVYDYPRKLSEKVPILEKIDGTNLSSSNETDDIQITCGQLLCSSQEDNKDEQTEKSPNANGLDIIHDGEHTYNIEVNVCDAKVGEKKNALSVEEMMADFVDEVQEDS